MIQEIRRPLARRILAHPSVRNTSSSRRVTNLNGLLCVESKQVFRILNPHAIVSAIKY